MDYQFRQYQERIKFFPEGLRYEVQIDVRGQNYTDSLLKEIEQNIFSKSNNKIVAKFIENKRSGGLNGNFSSKVEGYYNLF